MASWKLDANCRGTDDEAWFDESRETHELLERICLNCPVFFECEKEALVTGEEWAYRAGRWYGPAASASEDMLDKAVYADGSDRRRRAVLLEAKERGLT